MLFSHAHTRKKSRRLWTVFFCIAVFISAGVWYFFQPGFVSEDDYFSGGDAVQNVIITDTGTGTAIEPDTDVQELPSLPAGPVILERTIASGDTVSEILQEWLTPGDIQDLADLCEDVFPLHKLRQGNPYIITTERDELLSFVYEIDLTDKLIVSREPSGSFGARIEPIEYDTTLDTVQGVINANLFQTVTDAGEAPGLALALADIFAWEINFIRDIQPGDSFSLIVEKRHRDGVFKGYGRIRAAVFTNKGTPYEAFVFPDPEGKPAYFTSSGESVKRAFLKAPLSFTRISSTFSNSRLHPIYRVRRAHPGIDYAAANGTPVKTVGDGTVTYAGWGRGAGNYIIVRHNNGYETMYLHLSSFARSTKKGARVAQGDVIGYVGSTGDSTGPHLDFRMKKNGAYLNPLAEISPRTPPVAESDMALFTRHVGLWREFLDGSRDPLLFPPDEAVLSLSRDAAAPEDTPSAQPDIQADIQADAVPSAASAI